MTENTVAIIVPAYKAETTLPATLRSVLAQTYPHWEVYLVADDGADYEAFLAASGLRDPRFRFLNSGGIGRGASNARNVALEALTTPYAAILDADDRFKPDKLARAVAALEHHAIVTCASSATGPTVSCAPASTSLSAFRWIRCWSGIGARPMAVTTRP